MSDSTDNTNELDSYGVWVKKSPSENTDDNFDITDSLDLPDFEEQDSFEDTDYYRGRAGIAEEILEIINER